jgi:hypothetical protein
MEETISTFKKYERKGGLGTPWGRWEEKDINGS